MPSQHLSLDQFRAFVTVADCGSFSLAADRLSRTQSALTHQIRRLEEVLGERLILRSRGHFGGLTEEGARFLPRARGVLGTVETAWRSVHRRPLTGRVRVGVPDDFDIRWLIGFIGRFADRYPAVEVATLSDLSARLEERLARGDLDIAFFKRMFRGDRPAAEGEHVLLTERLRWVAGPLSPWDGTGPMPLVVFHDGCAYRRRLFDLLAEGGIASRIVYEGYSYANMRAAVAAGLGVSALPEGHIGGDCEALTMPPDGPDLPDPGLVELVMRGRPGDPITAAFCAELRDHTDRQPYRPEHVPARGRN